MSKPKPNSFANAMKKNSDPVGEGVGESSVAQAPARKSKPKPSRVATKHVGGYFDVTTVRQLKIALAEEDMTVQAMLEEALDMWFHSRKKPTIATKARG